MRAEYNETEQNGMEKNDMKWNGKGCDETDINLEQLSELIDLLMLYAWSIRCQRIKQRNT